MRISDWSSDVCSSDLRVGDGEDIRSISPPIRCFGAVAAGYLIALVVDAEPVDCEATRDAGFPIHRINDAPVPARHRGVVPRNPRAAPQRRSEARQDRKSDVGGKSVAVRVDRGGPRIIKKKK